MFWVRSLMSLIGRIVRSARTHPKATFVFFCLLCSALVGGLYAYANREHRSARRAVLEGRLDDARKHIGTAIRYLPSNTSVHLLAARIARLNGDFEDAEGHLTKCIQLDGGATEDVQLEFLLMRAQTGEVDEVAKELLLYPDRNHPDSEMVFETISRAFMHRLRYAPAYGCLNRWVEYFPESSKPHHYRGWVLERMNNADGAMKNYVKALELNPELTHVRLRIAEMYLDDKQPAEAIPHLELLRRQFPDRADVKARLGQCYYLQGKHTEARQLLEAAVIDLPDDTPLLLHLGKLDLHDDRAAKSEEWLRRALSKDPSDTDVRNVLVSALQAQGKRTEAARELQEFKRHKDILDRANHLLQEEALHPSDDPKAASEVGVLLLRIGQAKQALYWLDQALTRDPAHRPTHQALAEYYESQGDKQRAAMHRRRAQVGSGS